MQDMLNETEELDPARGKKGRGGNNVA